MSILVNKDTKVVIQGLGSAGKFHAQTMLDYGTRIVAAVHPGKAGESWQNVPIFESVREAAQKTGADASCIFVPAAGAADAMVEAADAGIRLVVCITEGVPVLDMVKVKNALSRSSTLLVGPNCPGVITPGECKLGIMPAPIHRPGSIGVVSRSGTLTYEAVDQLSREGFGQSTCIGIGGDPVKGLDFVDCLKLFAADPGTVAVVLIGEIGGRAEQEAAEFIACGFKKPVVAFIAGASAPEGKRMGHAGAIIEGSAGKAESKIRALEQAGVAVCRSPAEIGRTMKKRLSH